MLLLTTSATTVSQAEIYRWKDETGKVHFSDRPARDADAEKVEVRINTYESVSYDTSIFETDRKVVMYTASWCGVCKRAERYFEQNNIPYKAYDVEKSGKGRADYRRMKARGVPIILVGKKRMNGFSEQGFKKLYE